MELVNKVAQSGLITIDLESFFSTEPIIELDIKSFLYKELILKEIEFRVALKQYDWTEYTHKNVAIFCSSDAIIPQWAYMLIATYLLPQTTAIYYGNAIDVATQICIQTIKNIDASNYTDKKIIIKGCSSKQITSEIYIEITKKLQPVVHSLFFGEACSTVPIYKKKQI